MKESKNERLLVLYEAIGEIDPRVATSALDYRHKTNIKSVRLIIVLAACICILAATLIVGMNLALGGAKSEDPMADKNMENAEGSSAPEGTQATNDEMADDATAVTTPAPEIGDGPQNSLGETDKIDFLQNCLSYYKDSMAQINDSEVDTVLYNGKLTLILSDGAKLYAKAFENTENAESLKDALYISGEPIGDAEIPTYKTWISFGDGKVVTPYIEYSEENIFNGILFDYSSKVWPSDAFVTELKNLFENN